MKQCILTIIMVIIASSFATAQSNLVEQDIKKLDREWMVDAYLKNDAAILERVLADDFTLTFRDGKIYNKQREVDSLKSAQPVPATVNYDIDELKVRVYGNSAVSTGRFIIKFKDKDQQDVTRYARFTNTYVKRESRWQVVASQLTAVAQQ